MSEKVIYKSDCKHFLGHIPCKPNKLYGVTCAKCDYYERKIGKILIIKLGAIGDVIRTTPLLRRIHDNRRTRAVWWLTEYPDVVPDKVDKVLKMDFKSVLILQNTEFDWVINLDKDYEACALMASLKAKQKDGFTLIDGKPAPINERAEHKFITGIFDSENKKNTKSYPEEIFEICGWEFKKEQYILDKKKSYKWDIDNGEKKIIGLNTGCGDRWTSRLLPDMTWVELIEKLQRKNYYPILLGGKQEHYRNEYLTHATNALYLGYFELDKFISLVDQCDLVVSAVTMGAHIAIGLRKPLILVNNIFNANEFELYGRGEVIEPSKPCRCFFSSTCTNTDYHCIDYVTADDLYQAIKRNIKEVDESGTK